jgi:hypothetical protein
MRKKGGRKTGALPVAWLSLLTATQAMPPTPNPILKTQNQRKEAGRYAVSPLNFHDHLVLETEPDFMIILRLENADRRDAVGGK